MGDTKGCEWQIERTDGLPRKCGESAGFGMTQDERRYAIWLCKRHVPAWLRRNGLDLQAVLCGDSSHTPAPGGVPDVTGEFPALPTPFPNGG